jgi:hypothetical protein
MLGNTLFLTRNEQVSGSSPLAGSLFSCDLQVKLQNAKRAGRQGRGYLTATRR